MSWVKAVLEHNERKGGIHMAKTITRTEVKSTTKAGRRTETAPSDNFKKAKDFLAAIGENTFDFSVVVAKIYHGEEFKGKYEDFAACAQAEWGMGYRTAMNHVTVGDTVIKYEISKERAAGIGWTNFMEISSLFTPEMKKGEIDGMIKKAGKMTHDEVVRFKQETRKGRVGGEVQQRVKMTFQFLNEQADVILEGLKMAKELMGVEHDDTALEYIIVDWMNSHDPENVEDIKGQLKGEVEPEAEPEVPEEKPSRKTRADKGAAKKTAKPKAKKATKKGKKVADDDDDAGDDDDGDDDDDLGLGD